MALTVIIIGFILERVFLKLGRLLALIWKIVTTVFDWEKNMFFFKTFQLITEISNRKRIIKNRNCFSLIKFLENIFFKFMLVKV